MTSVAIRETADLYSYIDEIAAQKIKEDMYVDDMVTGGDTREEAESIKRNSMIILEKGGFSFQRLRHVWG